MPRCAGNFGYRTTPSILDRRKKMKHKLQGKIRTHELPVIGPIFCSGDDRQPPPPHPTSQNECRGQAANSGEDWSLCLPSHCSHRTPECLKSGQRKPRTSKCFKFLTTNSCSKFSQSIGSKSYRIMKEEDARICHQILVCMLYSAHILRDLRRN